MVESTERYDKTRTRLRDSVRRAVSRGDLHELPLAVSGEGETGADVIACQIREVLEDLVLGHPGGKILQHVVHGDTEAPDARLAAPLARFDGSEPRLTELAYTFEQATKRRVPPPLVP